MTLSKFLDPKNDIAFKRIFSNERHKNILIHFVNDILELKDGEQIEEIEYLSPMQDPEIASKKQSIVDVLCKTKNGVQLIVEMQVSPSAGFEKRAQYYAAKAYSRQLNKRQAEDGRYANLKAVIFIAITNHILFSKKRAYKSNHRITDIETQEHDLKDFSFTFIELPKFKKDQIESLSNIVEKWLYFFKYAQSTSEADLKRIIGSDFVIEQAYEALNQYSWTEAELLAYEQERKRVMDNQAVLDYQLDQAKETGKAEGMVEGIEKGRIEGVEEIAVAMLKQGSEVEYVASITKLSTECVSELKKRNID